MALFFLPTLKYMATFKVSVAVYNGDIDEFIAERMSNFDYGDSFWISKNRNERIKRRKMEIAKKLPTILPESLVDPVAHPLQPIFAEVHFWVRDHFHILKHIQKRHIMNNLWWKSDGTIDRITTSKQLIQNENIDKRVRFVIACMYFYEEDVLQLWQSMTAEEKENISLIDSDLDVRTWMKRLRENGASTLTEWIPEYLNSAHEELKRSGRLGRSRRIRISSFYSKLNKYDKRRFLHTLWPYYLHTKDLLLCYSLTDETERDMIFHNPVVSGFESKTGDLLCFYLDWPLQKFFLDMVNQMWYCLTPECLEHCLCHIVQQKLSKSMEDFDYLKLFKNLWNQIPYYFKGQFQRQTLIYARELLRYDKEASTLSIAETLEKLGNLDRRVVYFIDLYVSRMSQIPFH